MAAVQIISKGGLGVGEVGIPGYHHAAAPVQLQGYAVAGGHAGNGHVIFQGLVPGFVINSPQGLKIAETKIEKSLGIRVMGLVAVEHHCNQSHVIFPGTGNQGVSR